MPRYVDQKFFTVAYSPEWVAQGSIIDNQLNPDVVVVGHHDKDIQRSIIDAYELYIENMPTPICMSAQAAEATKYYSILSYNEDYFGQFRR